MQGGGRDEPTTEPGRRGRGRSHPASTLSDGLRWRRVTPGSGGPSSSRERRYTPTATIRQSSSSAANRPHHRGPNKVKRSIPRAGSGGRVPGVGFVPLSRDTYYHDHNHLNPVPVTINRGAENEVVRGRSSAVMDLNRGDTDETMSSSECKGSSSVVYLNEPAFGALRLRRPWPAWNKTWMPTSTSIPGMSARTARCVCLRIVRFD